MKQPPKPEPKYRYVASSDDLELGEPCYWVPPDEQPVAVAMQDVGEKHWWHKLLRWITFGRYDKRYGWFWVGGVPPRKEVVARMYVGKAIAAD